MSRVWTDEEYGIVQASDGRPLRDIAEELGRSVGAIKATRHNLRHGWIPRGPNWTAAEDSFIVANHQMTAENVAAHLSRTPSSVMGRRARLRETGVMTGGFAGNFSPFRPASRPMIAQTCTACGLLLQAQWFGRDWTNKSWSKTCKACKKREPDQSRRAYDAEKRRVSARRSSDINQALSTPTATNAGSQWTEADITVLKNPDMTALEKALTLKRTYYSTATAASRMGFKSKRGLGDPERDQWVIDNPSATRAEEITELLKASPAPEATPTHPKWDWDDKETA